MGSGSLESPLVKNMRIEQVDSFLKPLLGSRGRSPNRWFCQNERQQYAFDNLGSQHIRRIPVKPATPRIGSRLVLGAS